MEEERAAGTERFPGFTGLQIAALAWAVLAVRRLGGGG